ncbi:hypothetical protein D9M69_573050 [compost metagenome]
MAFLSLHQAKAAISPAVAENDIWKLGPNISCGEIAIIAIAEIARLRMLIAALSARSAQSITAIIT